MVLSVESHPRLTVRTLARFLHAFHDLEQLLCTLLRDPLCGTPCCQPLKRFLEIKDLFDVLAR
jgi:hypothetical protein